MDRSQEIIRTSWIGIVANVLLAGFKAAVGILASSVAIVMDAINNLSDALSSVITIVGTKLSQRPADRYTTTTLVVIVVAIVVKLILGQYVKKKGEQLKSDALIASGSDALFDAVITLATLISAGVMLLWGVSLDGILGALISVVIIKAGIEMLASPVNELLGTSISEDFAKQIQKEVADFEGVHGVFDLILHNYGPDVKIGSLHINVYDTMTAHEIHGLTRRISTQMYEKHGIIMTVGVYAIATGDNKRAELQAKVTQTLAAHKDIVQVHGFYYSEKRKYLSVDVVPDISVHDEAAFVSQLTAELQPLVPDQQVVVVVDHNYSE